MPHCAKAHSFYLKRGLATLKCMQTPHHISRKAIKDFKDAYKEEFGQCLSDEEVQEIAVRLLRFFGILTESPEKPGTGRDAKANH